MGLSNYGIWVISREEPSAELFHKIQDIVNLVVNPVVNLIVNTLRKAEGLMPRDIRSS